MCANVDDDVLAAKQTGETVAERWLNIEVWRVKAKSFTTDDLMMVQSAGFESPDSIPLLVPAARFALDLAASVVYAASYSEYHVTLFADGHANGSKCSLRRTAKAH
jgi:hypothetical protein